MSPAKQLIGVIDVPGPERDALAETIARDGLAVVGKLPASKTVRAGLVPTHSGHWVVRGALGLVGIYVISAGVTQFSLTVMDPSVPSAVQAGVYSIGGYAWTHVLIHQSLF